MKKDRRYAAIPAAKADPWSSYSDLIERIKALPEAVPAVDLTSVVMQKISSKKVSWWRRFRFALSRPLSITIVPVKWAPIAAGIVLLIFTLQMQITSRSSWNPRSQEAEFSYITGRRYLAENLPDQAIPHLQAAVSTSPENADYHFWLGVAYWATKDPQKERQSYQTALKLNPGYLPAHVYIGHNYLDQGIWEKALNHYEKVLKAVPDHPEALFNAALACRKLGWSDKENTLWTDYLNVDNVGVKADQALSYLNGNGDFTYRSILLGAKTIALRTPEFKGSGTALLPESHRSLQTVGRFLQDHPHFNLHVIVYQLNDRKMAKNRAKAVKTYLLTHFPEIERNRIKISWFDVAEAVEYNSGSFHLNSAVRLFAEPAGPANNV